MMPKSNGVRLGIVAGAMLAAGAAAATAASIAAQSAAEARAEARAVADLRQAAVDAYASAAETSPRVIAVASEPAPARAAAAPAPRRALPLLAAAPDSERRCLAEAIYFEANGESEAGQRAVAAVILNRTADPRYPKTICGVVYQGAQRSGCQFSFACDGVAQTPAGPGWNRARRIADQALSGAFRDPTHGATHFHATYVAPGWANRLIETAAIGLHVFYRYPGFGPAAAPARVRTARLAPQAAPAADEALVIAVDAAPEPRTDAPAADATGQGLTAPVMVVAGEPASEAPARSSDIPEAAAPAATPAAG